MLLKQKAGKTEISCLGIMFKGCILLPIFFIVFIYFASDRSTPTSKSPKNYELKGLKTGKINGYDPKAQILIDPVNIFKDYDNRRLGISGKARHGEKIVILENKGTGTPHGVKIRTESGVVGWLSN